jgi:hypothetical protein
MRNGGACWNETLSEVGVHEGEAEGGEVVGIDQKISKKNGLRRRAIRTRWPN